MSERRSPTWAVRLQTEREARKWSKAELGRRLLRATGSYIALDSITKQIRDHEAGVHFPSYWASAYAAVFGIDEQELFASAAGTVNVTVTVEDEADDEDDVKRRQLMQNAAAVAMGATAVPVMSALTEAWQTSQPRLPGASVSQAMIDDWAAGYQVHVRRYGIDPPATVLASLTRDWTEIAPHLATEQPDRVHRDLAHAAARHAYLIAAVCLQLGDHRFADRWWRTSHSLADRSGDVRLSAFTRSWEVTNRVLGAREDLGELLALAQNARRRAGRSPSVELVFATTIEAEVLAFMGQSSAAIKAMHQAEETFEYIPSAEPTREELLRFDQSCVYSIVGLPKDAAAAQDAAKRYYHPDEHLYTHTQIQLHGVLLHCRTDPGEASRKALNIIDGLPANRRDKRVLLAARRVLDTVPQRARVLPPVRELQAVTAGA